MLFFGEIFGDGFKPIILYGNENKKESKSENNSKPQTEIKPKCEDIEHLKKWCGMR